MDKYTYIYPLIQKPQNILKLLAIIGEGEQGKRRQRKDIAFEL